MSEWIDITREVAALEIPGVGAIVCGPAGNICFVPGVRIVNATLVRDDRTNPPLVTGRSAAEIRARQPLVVDPGAQPYMTMDVDDSEY